MNWELLVVLSIILILAVSGCTTGQVTQNTTPETPKCKTISEAYEIDVPYETQECDTVPYTDRVCEMKSLVYSMSETECKSLGLIGDWTQVKCTIDNLDDEAGTFSVKLGFNTKDGKQVFDTQNKYIYPQTSHTYEYQLQLAAKNCFCYEEVIPKKQVCRDVIKNREVCKTVTDYRTETRYRDKEVCS